MNQKHYKDQLNAFVDHELAKPLSQEIAEHLMTCGDCRAEHDRIKLGAAIAGQMRQSEAPEAIWNRIERSLDAANAPRMTLIPRPKFGFRFAAGYAVAAVVVMGLATAVYFTLFRWGRTDVVQHNQNSVPVQASPVQTPELALVPSPTETPGGPSNSNSNSSPIPATSPGPGGNSPVLASAPSWQVETISGSPKIGEVGASRIAVGDTLETDAASRARIAVANIGNVVIEPNSRVKLVGTADDQHRMALERGILKAKIIAPPRLFIVDTPSAAAVDLGCEYKLEVDEAGNSTLSVTSGFVALERRGRESIVPAGATCNTKRGRGLGTPFSNDASAEFRRALERFDFSGGGSRAVDEMLASRGFYDMITLWHLLSRVAPRDREKVFDALAGYVKPPTDVTREGIFKLDKKMLASWRGEVERIWFEDL